MSEKSQQLVQQILFELNRTRRRLASARTLLGLFLVVTGIAILWGILTSVESGFWLSPGTRSSIFWALAVALSTGIISLIIFPALQYFGVIAGPSDEDLARRIGSTSSSVSDRLLSLLSLSRGHHSFADPSMIDGAIQNLSESIDTSQFPVVEDFSRVKKAGRFAIGSVLVVSLLFILAPSTFIGASQRLLSPGTVFTRPLPFTVQVSPGSVQIVRGSSLNISVTASGDQPPESFEFEVVNVGETVSRSIEATQQQGAFSHSFANVRQDFRYRARSGGFRSDWYDVTVFERPVVKKLQVELISPSYARAPRITLDPNVGDVSGLRGTRVNLTADISGPEIQSARIIFNDGNEENLDIEDGTVSGSFIIRRSGSYHLSLVSIGEVENSEPIEYQVRAQVDESPSILLLSPDDNTHLTEANSVAFLGRIIDDYGFNRLAVNYKVVESRFGTVADKFSPIRVPLPDGTSRDQSFRFDWAMADQQISAVPGDEIEVYVEVWDNDSYSGFKSSTSNVVRLRFPSLSEQYEALEQHQDDAENQLDELLNDADKVREKFEELRDELRKNPESDWQNNRQIEQLREEQQRIEERVDEFTNEVEKLIEQMEENGLVSQETLDMYEELKKVSEEVNSPELMEALEELQDAMEQMSLDAMQEAVEKFEFSEDQYQKRLERTLDLFKKFKMQQSLDEVKNRAEELKQLEENLEEQTKQADEQMKDAEQNQQNPDSEQKSADAKKQLEKVADQQEMAKEDMEALLERLEEIREEMKDVKSAPQKQMQEMTEQLQDQKMPEKMQENADQLRQEQTQPAMEGQQQMQQQLNQMQQNLSQMQQNMTGSQMNINMRGLRQALDDILILSREQERVRAAVENLVGDSHMLRGYAQQQLEIGEGLSTVSDSLQKMAREIPQMTREVQTQTGEALREMGSSIEAMSDRVARRATGHQKSAMMHLNELAVLLSDLLSQMMNQQSGMGGGQSMEQMIEQMQNMAGQQQKLNQQLQEILNDAQGQRLTGDVQARLNQLAEQQDNLRKQLKQMSRNPDLRGKLLGDLNKIAEQMLESVDDLSRQRMNRNTVERQRQILTRMLESTKSMQERGREEKRESKSGEEIDRPGPEELEQIESADQLRRDLIRALEAGYSPDYEALIKKYFQLLEENGVESQ